MVLPCRLSPLAEVEVQYVDCHVLWQHNLEEIRTQRPRSSMAAWTMEVEHIHLMCVYYI
jgi:hypothetical protein